MKLTRDLLLLFLLLVKENKSEEEVCPESRPKLSGLDDVLTPEIARKWLKDNGSKIQMLKKYFVSPVEVTKKGVIKAPSVKKEEESHQRRQNYAKNHITNDLDYVLHTELDKYDQLTNSNPKKAHNKFKKLYVNYKSPRALFGMAVALKRLAERTLRKSKNLHNLSMKELENVKRDRKDEPTAVLAEQPEEMTDSERMYTRANERRLEALDFQTKSADRFCKVLTLDDVPLFLFLTAGRTCLELRRQRNERDKLIKALLQMRDKFPNAIDYPSELALMYLYNRQYHKAADTLRDITVRWPGKSDKEKALLGLTLSWMNNLNDSNVPECESEISSLLTFIKSSALSETAKAFNDLAEAYQRSGHSDEASFVFETGAQMGLFMSRWQRAPFDNEFYLLGLTSRPLWSLEDLGPVGQQLKEVALHWQVIRKEALSALFGSHDNFEEEVDSLRSEGQWQQLVLYENGHMEGLGCSLAPKTCGLLQKYLGQSDLQCQRGQIKFSVMHPGTHVWPHTGPTNTRLRAHLGLMIPDKGRVEMRVANKQVHWSEGKVFVLDDSFEHEVWQQGNGIRVVLLIDFWHPDLSAERRRTLSPLPIKEAEERSTVFHIGGIVSKLPDGGSSQQQLLNANNK
jgi:aspartate beta-hydroxylase